MFANMSFKLSRYVWIGLHIVDLDLSQGILASDMSPGGGHFHSKVIGMLVVFLGYKILILVFFRVFWKILGKLKQFSPKQPSKRPLKLQFGYFFRGLKSKSGYFLGFSKKISDEHTYHFYIKRPPSPGICLQL